jgi:hypothetical protein
MLALASPAAGGRKLLDSPPMAALVPVAVRELPAERHHRPVGRVRWYLGTLPAAAGLGLGLGVVMALAPGPPWIVVALLWAGLVGRSIGQRGRSQRMIRVNDEAQALLAAGEVARASAMFETLCRSSRGMPGLHSLFVYNRGVAYLRAGEPQRARALFLAVLRGGWFARGGVFSGYRPLLFAALASAAAIEGDVDDAIRWQRAAHDSVFEAKRGILLVVDAMIAARGERWAEVVRAVDEGWTRAENLLTASHLRILRLLRAFALERDPRASYRGESPDAEIRAGLAAARPFQSGEFDHLVARWPDFRQFLVRHGFVHDEPAAGIGSAGTEAESEGGSGGAWADGSLAGPPPATNAAEGGARPGPRAPEPVPG